MLFDVFRAVRAAAKHGRLMTAAEDACFCVLSVFIIWKCLWIFSGGELRLFEIIGFAAGAVLYILSLRRVFFLVFTIIFKNLMYYFYLLLNYYEILLDFIFVVFC